MRTQEEVKAYHRAYYVGHLAERSAYYASHFEEQKARMKAYHVSHREEISTQCRAYYATYYAEHYDRVIASAKTYRMKHPEMMKKVNARRRRELDYVPMNSSFPGSVGHHVDSMVVMNIPESLHQSISHDVHTGRGMEAINAAAFSWYTEGWT